MDKVKPAIVIIAFNRPNSIKRLLNSIEAANYKFNDIPLIISIDFQDSENNRKVLESAENFVWKFGEKKIIKHNNNLGLKKHILSCGDLTKIYGSVIILEDDLIVSPNFYNYAMQAAVYYKDEDKVAGVSLYSYEYEELGWYQFYPKNIGTDTFFMQWAASWGQLWTSSQWQSFKEWYNKGKDIKEINIPDQVKSWSKSWKKFYIAYLVDTDRYFVYPYHSYTTLRDEGGTHYVSDTRQNAVSLNDGRLRNSFNFSNINYIDLKYDVFFQPIKRYIFIEKLSKEIEIEFDLFGTKKNINYKADYICSVKNADAIIERYSNKLIPYENNLIYNELGEDLVLAKKESFIEKLGFYSKGRILYNTRKIHAIKEMVLVIIYRVISKFLKR